MTHSTHFYLWIHYKLKSTQIKEEIYCCRFMGNSFQLAAKNLLYALSNRQDSTYHSFCYIAGMRNNSIGTRRRIDLIYYTMNRKEGNYLFNDILNTVILWLYGKGPLSTTAWAILFDQQQRFFYIYIYHPINMVAHTTALVNPVIEHWLEREINQWVYYEGLNWQPVAPETDALRPSYDAV